MKKYDCFILKNDLNLNIKVGMKGVVLEIYDNNTIEVEFVKDDGTNIGYNESYTFTLKKDLVQIISKD